MFASRFFADRYFNLRYWASFGLDTALDAFTAGFPEVYKYRPRQRFKFKDEEDKQADIVVREIAVEIVPDTTERELEAALRKKLETRKILYKTLYLTWLIAESKRREKAYIKARTSRLRMEEEELLLYLLS